MCNKEGLGTPMSIHNLHRGSSIGDRQSAPVTSSMQSQHMQIYIPLTPTREVSLEQPGFSLVDSGYRRKPEKEKRSHGESANTTVILFHLFHPVKCCFPAFFGSRSIYDPVSDHGDSLRHSSCLCGVHPWPVHPSRACACVC